MPSRRGPIGGYGFAAVTTRRPSRLGGATGGGDGSGAALHHWLAPAGDSLIGLDLEEEPAGRDGEGGQAGNLHSWAPRLSGALAASPRGLRGHYARSIPAMQPLDVYFYLRLR
jgi:hypothetical protein